MPSPSLFYRVYFATAPSFCCRILPHFLLNVILTVFLPHHPIQVGVDVGIGVALKLVGRPYDNLLPLRVIECEGPGGPRVANNPRRFKQWRHQRIHLYFHHPIPILQREELDWFRWACR